MEFEKNKTKYFIIAIILLIILGVILIVHFNNKSMVSGDKETTTKKTTKKVEVEPTTKKTYVNDVTASKDIYKSVIDDETKLLYNYKLTDEILDSDRIISKNVDVTENLIASDVIGLFDISLYDSNMVKKSVTTSLITISIPISGDLVGYDEYKVVYIDNDMNITDEDLNTRVSDGYITFDTTHLSLYGIIGKKSSLVPLNNDIDIFKDVNISVLNNDEIVKEDEVLYFTKDNKLTLTVDGIENVELYYGLKSKSNDSFTYEKYIDDVTFSSINPYDEVTLIVKVLKGEKEKVYELNTIKVYDVIYNYDRNNPEGPEETSEETLNYLLQDVTSEEDEDVIENNDLNINPEVQSTIYLNGNIYIVDKADVSALEMTGTLFIDTSERIDLGTITIAEHELINSKLLDRIVIMSKKFNINGVEYTYDIDESGNVTIYKVEDNKPSGNPFDVNANLSKDEDNNAVIEFERGSEELEEPEEQNDLPV